MISPRVCELQLWYLILFDETAPMVNNITAKKMLAFMVIEAGSSLISTVWSSLRSLLQQLNEKCFA